MAIIVISALAAIAMEDISIPMINTVIPILVVMILQVILSLINLRYERARSLVCGTPSILIKNGKIVENELRRLRININDLLEQIRSKDYFNIEEIEYAILETNGQLSIIPKSQKRAVTPEDLNIETDYEGLPTPLILDGKLNRENLKQLNLSEKWIQQKLEESGIEQVKDVFFASLDTSGVLFLQEKNDSSRRKN